MDTTFLLKNLTSDCSTVLSIVHSAPSEAPSPAACTTAGLTGGMQDCPPPGARQRRVSDCSK